MIFASSPNCRLPTWHRNCPPRHKARKYPLKKEKYILELSNAPDSIEDVCLIDFGLAKEPKKKMRNICGTPAYVAPEILTKTGYGPLVDMWAIGVLTFTM